MAKQNDKANKEGVEQSLATVPSVQETTGSSGSSAPAPAAQEQAEAGEKELQISPERNTGEPAPGEGNTEMDSKGQGETVEEKGNETVDRVTNPEPEKKTEKRNEIAASIFLVHPHCKMLYFTSDLIPFFEKNDAIRHAAGALKDETVVTINRE